MGDSKTQIIPRILSQRIENDPSSLWLNDPFSGGIEIMDSVNAVTVNATTGNDKTTLQFETLGSSITLTEHVPSTHRH